MCKGNIFLILVLTMGLLIAGCRYTPPESECTPPAVKMLDVNGNSVCVLPEIKEGETGPAATEQTEPITGEEPAVAPEEGTPTGAVVGTQEETPTEAIEGESKPAVAETKPAAGMPQKIVMEGDMVNFPNLKATDPDGDPIKYTFTTPLNAQGEWQTKKGDAGEYKVTITASDGQNTVSQDILIVVKSANKAPIIQIAPEIKVKEGDTVTLNPSVTDAEGDKVDVKISGWMTTRTYATNYDDAGNYIVTITASDGQNTVSKDVKILVENVNRAPVIAPLADITVTEGDKVIIEPTVTDPDGDKLTVSFSGPLDSSGMWQSRIGDAGTYKVDVTASDGSQESKRSFTINVKSANKAPIIKINPEVTVKEGETVTLSPTVTDPEGDKVTISYSGWMTSSTYKTTYDDSGTHTVTITASDGVNTVSQDVKVVVQDVNRPPEFVPGSFI
jgi:nitrogen fixation protein FixH